MQDIKIEEVNTPKWECAAFESTEFYELYGFLFFLGILLGIVFVFVAVLIIYYKQISRGTKTSPDLILCKGRYE